MPAAPLLDVIVPVHSVGRPVERAVRSVLTDASAADVRVSVVAHGIDPAAVDRVDDPRVRVLAFVDGVRSAAGPMNAGLEAATAEYVCRLDSDDVWEPGALDAWMPVLRAGEVDMLIPRLRVEGRPDDRNPLTRPWRRRRLDAVKDRLLSRTAVFGPIRRSYLRATGARYVDGLEVGEDLLFGLRLYFGGGRIDALLSAPGLLVLDDAADRVTGEVRSVARELQATIDASTEPWVRALRPSERQAIAIKLLRIHVLGVARSRTSSQTPRLSPAEATDVERALTAIRSLSATAEPLLTRAERAELMIALGRSPVAPLPKGLLSQLTTPVRFSMHRHSVLRRFALMRLPR